MVINQILINDNRYRKLIEIIGFFSQFFNTSTFKGF